MQKVQITEMDFSQLSKHINLYKKKIDLICYCDSLSKRKWALNKEFKDLDIRLQITLKQIAFNLGYLIKNFSKYEIEELIDELKKNAIKGFVKDYKPNTRNNDAIISTLSTKSTITKSKLMYIYNMLWLFIRGNKTY